MPLDVTLSADCKAADDTRVQAFVIRGERRETRGRERQEQTADRLGELPLVLSWSEWPPGAGSGAARGGLAVLQPQH